MSNYHDDRNSCCGEWIEEAQCYFCGYRVFDPDAHKGTGEAEYSTEDSAIRDAKIEALKLGQEYGEVKPIHVEKVYYNGANYEHDTAFIVGYSPETKQFSVQKLGVTS